VTVVRADALSRGFPAFGCYPDVGAVSAAPGEASDAAPPQRAEDHRTGTATMWTRVFNRFFSVGSLLRSVHPGGPLQRAVGLHSRTAVARATPRFENPRRDAEAWRWSHEVQRSLVPVDPRARLRPLDWKCAGSSSTGLRERPERKAAVSICIASSVYATNVASSSFCNEPAAGTYAHETVR
jgi:hypothetical protein